MEWQMLSREHPVIESVYRKWTELLAQPLLEGKYHSFLRDHAGLFFTDGVNSHVTVSKLKLGSRLEVDFAVAYENYSQGLFWELIEIKTPDVSPYSSTGNPSAILVKAIQQVEDWKAWLVDNRREAERLFCTNGVRTSRNPNFFYTIIIGNRSNSERFLDKRNKLSQRLGVDIRSFDYLTDRFSKRPYLNKAPVLSGMWNQQNPDLCKELANPFSKAFGDSSWKRLLSYPEVGAPHFTSNSCKHLLAHRDVNDELVKAFEVISK